MELKHVSWAFLALQLSVSAGCSLALDLETKQCSTTGDCDKLAPAPAGKPGSTYVCTTKHICERLTCDPKNGNQDCRGKTDQQPTLTTALCQQDSALDGAYSCQPADCTKSANCDGEEVCNTESNLCVKPSDAQCNSELDAECAKFDSLPVCRDKGCIAKECDEDKNCTAMSATAMCIRGKCVDEAWGCIGEPDDREPVTEPGVYELSIVDAATNVIPPDLTVKLCGSINDFSCTNPPAAAMATIDKAKGVLRVTNVPPNTQMHFQLYASGIFDTEFFSQRAVNGKTVESVKLILIPKSLIPVLTRPTDVPVDTENNATFVGRFFDCVEDLAPGLTLGTSRFNPDPSGTGTDTRVFYIKEGNLPDPDAVVTNDYSAGGIVNLAGGKQTTLSVTLGRLEVNQLVLIPKAGWITVAHFYPRDYAK